MEAYKDQDKFPNGPYCKEGDWVIFRSYSGTRFKVENQEFRIINDDTVEAVVEDPRGVKKSMSELSKIEDETEFEPVDQGEETQETAADDGFEIEVVDDRPIEDRVPPRSRPCRDS